MQPFICPDLIDDSACCFVDLSTKALPQALCTLIPYTSLSQKDVLLGLAHSLVHPPSILPSATVLVLFLYNLIPARSG